MGEFICHHDGRFFLWSTVVDSPTTFLMSEEELKAHYKEERGNAGLVDLPDRLARAVRTGTSARHYANLRDLVEFNRAGPNDMIVPYDRLMAALASEEDPRYIPAEECQEHEYEDE